MDTFEKYKMLSLSLSHDKRKVVIFNDKKRVFSVYYNITPIPSCNYSTSKIAKASDFTTK